MRRAWTALKSGRGFSTDGVGTEDSADSGHKTYICTCILTLLTIKCPSSFLSFKKLYRLLGNRKLIFLSKAPCFLPPPHSPLPRCVDRAEKAVGSGEKLS